MPQLSIACDNEIILKLRLKPYILLCHESCRALAYLASLFLLLHNRPPQRHYMASSSRLQDDVDLSGRAPGPEDDELYGSDAPDSGFEPTPEIHDSEGGEFGYVITPMNHPQPDGNLAKALLPSAELWFPEGDIILLCENIGFRVDKQSLVTHSEIFNDLFVNGGMTVDERAQDCDLIRLPDGSAEIFHMLKALHYET